MSEDSAIRGLTIRPAEEADVAVTLRFIQDLAEYERLRHEAVATEEDLRRHLFGERPAAEVIIAEVEGEAVGFALFFTSFSTFLGRPGLYLEDLFVSPTWRGRGIGRRMLAHLARITRDRGYGRLEWWVLDWNEPAIGFYRGLGARAMDEWTTFRLTGEALERLAGEG
jgi:GNAT superfamily N-acetyltransferase